MSEIAVEGSCLCGSVKYKITGEANRFYHCHCQRCRKATGTGHASNLVISPQTSIQWLKGIDFLSSYKVPESERFYNFFCNQCGSPLPKVVAEIDAVLIPAGTLDCAPPMQPQGRIFWDSRASWSCEDDLPVFSEYPPNI